MSKYKMHLFIAEIYIGIFSFIRNEA